MLAARTGKPNLFPSLLVPALLCSLRPGLSLELHRSCLESGWDKMSPRGGREQTSLQQTRAVLLDITVSMGFSPIPLPVTGKLPSTTAGEFSPKSFCPDDAIASSSPDRRRPHSATHRNVSPMVSVNGPFAKIIQALHLSSTDLGFFQQMIAQCSISAFVLVIHKHKWPQILTVPAPYHHFKGELSGQSYFTVVKCLCLISCLLSKCL